MDQTWEPPWRAPDERPARLRDVPYRELPQTLRILLAWEGVLANALSALRRTQVVADVEGHEAMLLDADHARWLEARPRDRAISRRTALRETSTGRLVVHADSVLLPDRLPAGFLDVLAGQAEGLGGAFAHLRLETRRELLWFGRTPMRGLRRGDVALAGAEGISRCYRLIALGAPVVVIEETFPDGLFGERATSD